MEKEKASVKLGTFVLLVILVAIAFGGAGYLYGINAGKTIATPTKTPTVTTTVASSKTATASVTSTASTASTASTVSKNTICEPDKSYDWRIGDPYPCECPSGYREQTPVTNFCPTAQPNCPTGTSSQMMCTKNGSNVEW